MKAMKGYSACLKAPALLKPYHQIVSILSGHSLGETYPSADRYLLQTQPTEPYISVYINIYIYIYIYVHPHIEKTHIHMYIYIKRLELKGKERKERKNEAVKKQNNTLQN